MPLRSDEATEAALAPRTAEKFKWLLEVRHPDIPDSPRRFCNDTVPIVSNGKTYEPFPFRIRRPAETNRPPEAPFEIVNVDNEIGTILRAVMGRITLRFMRVLVSQPDRIEETWDELQLMNVGVDAMWVKGKISQKRYDQEPVTRIRITPAKFPTLYE